jgi:hypothetical protein
MRNTVKSKPSSVLVGLLLLTLVACPTPAPDPTPPPATFATFGKYWGDPNGTSTLNAPGCDIDQKPIRTTFTLFLDDPTAPDLLGRMSLGLVVNNPPPSTYIDFTATVTTGDEITGTLKGSNSFSLPFKGNVTRVAGAATQIKGSFVGPGGCVIVGGTSIVGTVTTQFTLVPTSPF